MGYDAPASSTGVGLVSVLRGVGVVDDAFIGAAAMVTKTSAHQAGIALLVSVNEKSRKCSDSEKKSYPCATIENVATPYENPISPFLGAMCGKDGAIANGSPPLSLPRVRH